MILKLSELRVIACAQFAKNEWKDYCDFVDIEFQKLISHYVTRWLSIYPCLPRKLQMYLASHPYFISIDKPTVALKRFSGNSERILFKTLRRLQSFEVAFNELVQNIKKSKASFIEVVLFSATVKARIQERQSDVHTVSSQIKSALRKVREGKDHDCDSFRSESDISVFSIVQVLC